MKNKLLIISFFLLSLFATSESNAMKGVGLAAGIDLDLPANLFIEGDVFANYYGDDTINYNYGAKGDVGFKMLGISAYALGGLQHVGFANGESRNYKDDSSPIYGVGIGYNFPLIPIGVRLENTYFSLTRTNGAEDRYNNINASLIFIF